ncbi:MAG: hypothetical protein HFF29_04995, partial [Oscillospiraceae bacterium]|nr:hypothetical protein [Oscillospiraceae bacterium]
LKLWYDNGKGVVSNNKKHVYAYFDKATHTDVVTVQLDEDGNLPDSTKVNGHTDANYNKGGRNLFDLIEGAGFKAPTADTVVAFNNSFSKFGSDFTAAGAVGNGVLADEANAIASPVRMYKLISNNGDKKLDAVIALNIESSQITESNNVNRVPTIGVPVTDAGTVPTGAGANAQLETMFITAAAGPAAGINVKSVNGVLTGVIAQNALVGNSTKTLSDYEFGIHITGTSPRTVSAAETQAIIGTGAERAYFLMNKVTATKEGTVVAYNTAKGTVTLDDGTVLERSKYYHTVVGWDDAAVKTGSAPDSVIPQAWIQGGTNWEEGYANVGYKFYTDHEGKYLGAERTYGSTFLYGTYLDYDQKTSTSTFNYYLTGVTLDGEIETKPVSKYWSNATTLSPVSGTDLLGVPFRDTYGNGANQTSVNGLGEGVYTGFAFMGETADGLTADAGTDRSEYLNNMARLGIKYGTAFTADVTINNTSTVLGAEEAVTDKYFTEATKFILVSGFGTDSVKAEVYNGITELRGTSSQVNIDFVTTDILTLNGAWDGAKANTMTYFVESPYTYAQTGDTAMKVDTIILPKEAVSWVGGSGLFYVGDPTPTLTNSWGIDAWKYNLYQDGELKQVWLTNNPSVTTSTLTGAAANSDTKLAADTFLQLKSTGETANDGEPIYTAGVYNPTTGAWLAGGDVTDGTVGAAGSGDYLNNDNLTKLLPAANGVEYATGVVYSAVTRDAQTATFNDGTNDKLLRVAEAKVVNLNAEENCVVKPASGYIWPGITDLQTLNQAGSIDPVTGRALKVSAVVDPSNPLIVTCIYVCYDQTP